MRRIWSWSRLDGLYRLLDAGGHLVGVLAVRPPRVEARLEQRDHELRYLRVCTSACPTYLSLNVMRAWRRYFPIARSTVISRHVSAPASTSRL